MRMSSLLSSQASGPFESCVVPEEHSTGRGEILIATHGIPVLRRKIRRLPAVGSPRAHRWPREIRRDLQRAKDMEYVLGSVSICEYVIASPVSAAVHQEKESFEIQQEAFEKMKPALMADERFRGKYVAVVSQRIVDSDESEVRLVKRVTREHRGQPTYIGKVTEKEEILLIPGPFC